MERCLKTKLDQELRMFQECPGDTESVIDTDPWCFHRRMKLSPRPWILMVLGLLRQEKYLQIQHFPLRVKTLRVTQFY